MNYENQNFIVEYELLLAPIKSTKGAFIVRNGKGYIFLREDLPIGEATEVVDSLIQQVIDRYVWQRIAQNKKPLLTDNKNND